MNYTEHLTEKKFKLSRGRKRRQQQNYCSQSMLVGITSEIEKNIESKSYTLQPVNRVHLTETWYHTLYQLFNVETYVQASSTWGWYSTIVDDMGIFIGPMPMITSNDTPEALDHPHEWPELIWQRRRQHMWIGPDIA